MIVYGFQLNFKFNFLSKNIIFTNMKLDFKNDQSL